MKRLLTPLFLTIALMAQAQKFSYNYYFNDPKKINNTKFYLDLLTFEGGSAGAGLHCYFRPVKGIFINGLFRYQYLDILGTAEKASTNKIETGYHGEASAQLQFAGYVKKKEKRTPVRVSTTSSMRVKAKVHRSFYLRGGAMMYRSTIVAWEEVPFTSNGKDLFDPDKGIFANQTGSCFFAGYAGKKVRKVGIDVSTYGKRRTFLARTFFMDAIVGETLLSNVTYNNATYDIKDTKRDKIGYRLGWEWEENGTSIRFEVGKKPGFNQVAMYPINYYMLSFGCRIIGREKFIFPEKKEEPKK
ncbi:MAG: hypothetical protein ACKVQB_07665 [Bacteroidia bacterium]